MQIFFFKSLLSLIVLASSLAAIFTAFELFGRSGRTTNRESLIRAHRVNGIFFYLLSLGIAVICIGFLFRTKAEPGVRATFHSLFSVAVLLILSFKILVVWRYRQFYARLQTAGFILVMMTFGMIGTSGGYYLLVTKFGHEAISSYSRSDYASVSSAAGTDPESIMKGRNIYEDKCTFCHDPMSNSTKIGPGHKGILKNRALPVSGRPATPENVAAQLRSPYRDMPSFSYLTDDQVRSLIAYLNTL